MAKFYAVKVGKKTGIYKTWAEAEEQVKGFPNAKFKSFTSEEEALQYLVVEESDNQKNQNHSGVVAYVDGSFNKQKKQYGSGIAILKDNKVIDEISIAGNKEDYLESYQVAGEVIGCLEAMKWALKHAEAKLIIYYDYQGIESWATGEWQAKKPISMDYVREFNMLKKEIAIEFRKVKGHSGDTFNDLADKLAKEAANQNIKTAAIVAK